MKQSEKAKPKETPALPIPPRLPLPVVPPVKKVHPDQAAKKIKTLAQIAGQLRKGEDFQITRLTVLKSLCSDHQAAAHFALHIARLVRRQMESRPRHPTGIKAEAWERYKKLAAEAVRLMARHLKKRTWEIDERLQDLRAEAEQAQNQYEHHRWADVRIIHSMERLMVEKALHCVLNPWNAEYYGYHLARNHAERYDSRYGTGLIPASAPMVEEIADFWGKYHFGRGWRKQVGLQ